MIDYDPIHLMATFLNPKTRKMNHLSPKRKDECIEYVKQEMLLFDVNQNVKSTSTRKTIELSRSTSSSFMTDFYLNAETEDEDDDHQQESSKTSSHLIEIDLYMKHGSDKTTTESNSNEDQVEYNPLTFWRKKCVSYPILAKVAARVFSVPATSAAVEREFSFTGNILTQKRSKLCPDTVNDIVFNHSYNIFKKRFGDSLAHDVNEL
jgi:hypothetical protein